MMRRFSRRMFGSLLLSTLAVPAVQAAQRVWDVIVVGAGGAGLSAAVSAAEAGAKVLLLEKMPHIGGNTRISGGFYACVDLVRQKRQGIEDSEQLFLSQMLESGGGHANPKLAAILVHNATPALKWLEKLGMRFQPTVSEAYGSRWPRSHKPLMPNGEGYIRTLSTAAVKLGVIIKTSTPVTTLLTDNDGRVCGVQIAENNIRKNIFSKRGVIVASGGFGANPAMIARYAPQFSGLTTNNMPGSTGEMLLAAQKAGAELVDMEDVLCNPGLPPGRVMRARFHMLVDQFILVDQTGRRFIREDASRAAVTRAILALPGKVAYTIIDSKGMKNLSILMQKEAVLAVESGDAWTADTIEDLARLMKLPAANLQATIDDYNTGMKTGQDPLGKVAPRGDFSLDHPPYWACFAGMSIHYTMGGIRINELAQAMRADGRPVAGLWAAGEATGGIHGKERLGGNGINDAVVFGRIAGQQGGLPSKQINYLTKHIARFIHCFIQKNSIARGRGVRILRVYPTHILRSKHLHLQRDRAIARPTTHLADEVKPVVCQLDNSACGITCLRNQREGAVGRCGVFRPLVGIDLGRAVPNLRRRESLRRDPLSLAFEMSVHRFFEESFNCHVKALP